MKKYYALFLLICVFDSALAQTQYNELRYRHAIFSHVSVQNNVQYGTAPQWIWPYWNEDLKMDVYQPVGDVVANRPLIIFAHAGGFLNGSKNVDNMVAICDSFARKGYVTATLDYRKGFNPLDAGSAERAVYRGVQDGKAAVRYFKQNAALYGIDTNFVYFGGMSAGGFMALHVAYMDLESERPASTYGGGTVNNLGCLDCSGNSFSYSSKIRAVLNYWGAIQDTVNIVAGDIPILQMHGTDDPTVPFTYGQPFGLFTLPNVYGSDPVNKRVDNLGIYNEFYTSSVPGRHMLDGSDNGTFTNPPVSFWYDTLLPRTTDFLVLMTKNTPTKVSADSVNLCFGEQVTFEVNGNPNSYYKWIKYTSGVSEQLLSTTNSLTYTFPSSGNHLVSVVEFNEVFCSSDTLWFYINQIEELNPVQTSADAFVLCTNETATISVSGNATSTYEWTWHTSGMSGIIENSGSSIDFATNSGGISVAISVVEINASCVSDTLWFHVIQQPEIVASFNYQINGSTVSFLNTSTNGEFATWNFGDGQTSSLFAPTHTYTENGTYIVVLTMEDSHGCSYSFSQTIEIGGLSIETVVTENISVFPNPFENVVHIQNNDIEHRLIKVTDVSGKVILNELKIEPISGVVLYTHTWSEGVYLIVISDENNGVNSTVKIVK